MFREEQFTLRYTKPGNIRPVIYQTTFISFIYVCVCVCVCARVCVCVCMYIYINDDLYVVIIIVFFLRYMMYVYSLPVIYDKLPYTRTLIRCKHQPNL